MIQVLLSLPSIERKVKTNREKRKGTKIDVNQFIIEQEVQGNLIIKKHRSRLDAIKKLNIKVNIIN